MKKKALLIASSESAIELLFPPWLFNYFIAIFAAVTSH
jgi:hypothetical protein